MQSLNEWVKKETWNRQLEEIRTRNKSLLVISGHIIDIGLNILDHLNHNNNNIDHHLVSIFIKCAHF